ncbi:type II toxin-antitoxin system RelE/ParE family toxin [Glycocaulis sp.]|uniref:type II toxin-antitoxin system RelE/ParE family toxin n=1 Tax=Glycocaulis sp. TaxID=1969725 RepID=UPI003F71F77C
MAELRLSAEAKADLRDIALYTEAMWGRDQRNAYIFELEAVFVRLASMPGLGRQRGDVRPGVFSFPAGRHDVWYRQMPPGIEILRVLHTRQSSRDAFS